MSDDWVEVARVSSLEAHILQAALDTAGIPAQTLGETVGELYALSASKLGEVRVLVPPDRAEEARALLDTSETLDFPEGD